MFQQSSAARQSHQRHQEMSNTLYLYSSDSKLGGVTGAVGLLCELAPDSPSLERASGLYKPSEMLGSADDALRVAYSLVSKLLRASPMIEGLPLLSVFEESLLEEFSRLAQAFYLDRWISERGFSTCRFVSPSPWNGHLRQVRAASLSTYELVADRSSVPDHPAIRALKRLRFAHPTRAEILQRAAPRWSRLCSAIPTRVHAHNTPRGGAWFYSTAYNFTRIGLAYEAYIPGKLNFLVEDPATGGKDLRRLGKSYYALYGWSRASDFPDGAQLRSMGESMTATLAAVQVSGEERLLRDIFLKSDYWRYFLRRDLPPVLYSSRAIERWSKAICPELIVVGNAAYERVLLMRESTKRIPVVMLQHGVMHWTYAVADQPVDLFLVRGPFFQRMINDGLRSKSVVLNYPERSYTSAENARGDILFITAPYEILPLFHPEDRRDILRSLLRVSSASRRRLVVRVHPMEKIAAYEGEIRALQAELGSTAEVEYSQGPEAEQVLARACVAVLHFSTMFLDCLRHGIPIVSFGWHWFPNKQHFADEGIFNFASDLANLEELVRQGIDGRLPRRTSGLDEFLAPSQPEEISKCFREIKKNRNTVTADGSLSS